MLKRFGDDALIKMLVAYRRGLTTDRAIDECFHVDKADFEKGYLTYLDEVVKTIRTRVNEEKPVKFSQLERQLKEKPDDPDLNARMAYEHFARRDYKEARPFADKALKLKPHHPLASYVKARLLVTIGDDDAALALLGAGPRSQEAQRAGRRPPGRAQDEGRPARRGREALRAGPQGRPVPHQVDRRPGAGPPAAEEHGQVPGRPGDDRRQRRRRPRRAQGPGRAAPGREPARRGRKMGDRVPAHRRLRPSRPRPPGRRPGGAKEVRAGDRGVPDRARPARPRSPTT